MIKRGPTHVIDTLAVRTILSDLPAEWLVRNLEERDYGIDLTIEMFEGYEPTGKIALIQVKGREKPFRGDISIQFPVKTIEYAMLFPELFFLFHTSNESKETYFIWIQKYASTKLKLDSPKWRTQGKVKLFFPRENTLKRGRGKIEDIMARSAARIQAFEYLSAMDRLEEYFDELAHGNPDFSDACLRNLERMRLCNRFLSVYATNIECRPIFLSARNVLEALTIQLATTGVEDPEVQQSIQDFEQELESLHLIKRSFLDEDTKDEFAVECDNPPY